MYEVLETNKSLHFTYFKVKAQEKLYFIKKLNKEALEYKSMLEREIALYDDLKEFKFIPKIFRYNLEEDNCIMYEYINGTDLENCSLELKEVIYILFRLAEQVELLHAKEIIHCDLKPSNILIGNEEMYIIDFANARKIGEKTEFGSKRYCSVEQLEQNEVNAFFDIYSIGVIMYELLTKKYAFKKLAKKELIEAKKKDPLVVFDVPLFVNDIIEKATSYEKEKRYKTISEMKEDLQKLIEQCK